MSLSGLGLDAGGTRALDPLLRGEREAVEASLTFNPVEFDGIKTEVIDLLPKPEGFEAAPQQLTNNGSVIPPEKSGTPKHWRLRVQNGWTPELRHRQSEQGVLFERVRRPSDVWRALEDVFDYASGTISGEPSELPNGRWQVGEAVSLRAEGWKGPPDLGRITAARYAYADSRSESGP